MKTKKTYWHLQQNKKIPTPYEVATSGLLYYVDSGFEINVPVKPWFDNYQKNSIVGPDDLKGFADPRQTIYSQYVEIQRVKESYINQTLEIMERTYYDSNLSADWVENLDFILPQLRFVFHGLQMLASYIGHMAPDSRVTMVCAFQAADEMRRIQHFAYRMRHLQNTYPSFGVNSKSVWEKNKTWQPMRKLIEQALVVYDWFEAFILTNLIIKPALDEFVMVTFPQIGKENGDFQLENIFSTLNEDCKWHLMWSNNLFEKVLKKNVKIKETYLEIFERWHPQVIESCLKVGERLDNKNKINLISRFTNNHYLERVNQNTRKFDLEDLKYNTKN